MNSLKELYNKAIKPELMKKFNYSSVMEIPKLEKIVVNIGVGDGSHDEKMIEAAVKDLETITGQHPGVSPKAFDGKGNYTLGIKDQLIFPEIEYDNVVKLRGMDIVFVTTAKTNEEALELLKGFGIPFRK